MCFAKPENQGQKYCACDFSYRKGITLKRESPKQRNREMAGTEKVLNFLLKTVFKAPDKLS